MASPVHHTAQVGQKPDGATAPESTSTEVARGDERSANGGRADREVDRKGGSKDGGPDSPAEDEDRDKGDACGWPDRRHLAMNERKSQAEASGDPVDQSQQRQAQCVT
jgi:hypothetical protein